MDVNKRIEARVGGEDDGDVTRSHEATKEHEEERGGNSEC